MKKNSRNVEAKIDEGKMALDDMSFSTLMCFPCAPLTTGKGPIYWQTTQKLIYPLLPLHFILLLLFRTSLKRTLKMDKKKPITDRDCMMRDCIQWWRERERERELEKERQSKREREIEKETAHNFRNNFIKFPQKTNFL